MNNVGQCSLHVTATCHYNFKMWDTGLQYASLFTETFGAGASVVAKLAWKMLVYNVPHLTPLVWRTRNKLLAG